MRVSLKRTLYVYLYNVLYRSLKILKINLFLLHLRENSHGRVCNLRLKSNTKIFSMHVISKGKYFRTIALTLKQKITILSRNKPF